MVNDTTTLQGSLDEMKDQLIYQLGQKRIIANYSSSTGLLGLISKINDIGGSIIFEDDCDNASGLSNYGSSVMVRGSNSSMNISYDSTENAYKVAGSGTWYSIIPITGLNDQDNYIISADIKVQSRSETGVGFCLDNRNDSTSYSYAVWMVANTKLVGKQFNLDTDGTVNQHTGLSLSSSQYYTIKLIVNGSSLSGELYDGDTLISSDSTTLIVDNRQMGIFLMTQNGTTNSACWVKNIKVETIGDGSSISLSSNKSIISYYDNESATLTAFYKTGATMELWDINSMTKIGNFTESNGTYTYTYNSTGDGDVNLIARVGSKISEPILIEDCLFYGINTNAFTIPSNTTFSSDGTKITATTSTSSEKQIYFNHTFNQSDDFLYEVEVAQLGTGQSVALLWNDTDFWGGHDINGNYALAVFGYDSESVNHTWAVGDKFKIVKENGTSYAYINDTVFKTSSATYNNTFKVGFYTNSGRTQYVKNIKIKLL